jgi:hypothetical protein
LLFNFSAGTPLASSSAAQDSLPLAAGTNPINSADGSSHAMHAYRKIDKAVYLTAMVATISLAVFVAVVSGNVSTGSIIRRMQNQTPVP